MDCWKWEGRFGSVDGWWNRGLLFSGVVNGSGGGWGYDKDQRGEDRGLWGGLYDWNWDWNNRRDENWNLRFYLRLVVGLLFYGYVFLIFIC